MKMSWACNPPLQSTKLLQIELFELESKAGCCIYKYLTGCCIFITRQLVLQKKKKEKKKKRSKTANPVILTQVKQATLL